MENEQSQPANGHQPSAISAWLQLLRAPNFLTVPGDPLAGWLLANGSAAVPDVRLAALLAASVCFYASGLILNDVADFETDAAERPSRPLPSRRISVRAAQIATGLLLGTGLLLCVCAGGDAFQSGIFLVVAIVAYNQVAKRHAIAGPLVMGLCRGLNLLLGASLLGIFPARVWICAAIEIAFIARVTSMARRETSGGKITPKLIGALLSMLIPMQAIFCAVSGAGRIGWICAAALLILWPLNRVLVRRYYAS